MYSHRTKDGFKGTVVAVTLALLAQGCDKASSDESMETSELVFSYAVADSAAEDSLRIDARVTERNGGFLLPVNLVGGDKLTLVGEGGEVDLEREGEPGDYVGVFNGPVRADHWEYGIDLTRNGIRQQTATVDLRTRPTNLEVTYDASGSALGLRWSWTDGTEMPPSWTPSTLHATFALNECIYDDGEVVPGNGSKSNRTVWQRANGAMNATVPLTSIPAVFPENATPGTCELEVSVGYNWFDSRPDEGEPPLIVVDESFANDEVSGDRGPTQDVTIESETRAVSVRVGDR